MNWMHKVANFFSGQEKQFIPRVETKNTQEIHPSIIRKWKQLILAMEQNNVDEVERIQQILIRSSMEVPTTLSRARELVKQHA